MRAATVALEPVDPADAAARTATRAYFAELDERFPGGFDPEDAEAADAAAMRPGSGGRFLVAVSDGEPVACGGVQRLEEGVGEVKRMWVRREWRGVGLGRRLLLAIEDEARALGFRTLRLDTNRTLGEALALYGSAGYAEIERYNENRFAQAFFEKHLR